ncbi:TPA: hypothetical protein ACX6SO_001330 [Photobacterium damselae]
MAKSKNRSLNTKRLEQLTAFKTIFTKKLSSSDLEDECFSLLNHYRQNNNPTESLNVLRNFLSFDQAKEAMQNRYIIQDFELYNIKRLSRHPSNSLCDELNWISEILLFFKDELNQYVTIRDDLEKNLLFGEYQSALLLANKIEDLFGISQYSTTSKLNIFYFLNDIEQHTTLNEKFQNISCGLSKTVLIYDGVKTNISVSPDRYYFVLGKMKEEFNFSGVNKYENVINFRHDFNPKLEIENIYDLVRNDSEMRLIDLYNFYIKTIGYLKISNINLQDHKNQLKKLSDNIIDPRLNKISSRINKIKTNDYFTNIHYKIAMSYYKEEYEKVIELCEKHLDINPIMSSLYESYVKSILKVTNSESKYKNGVIGIIINTLLEIYNDKNRPQNLKNLEKIQQVLNHYPWSVSLRATIDKYNGDHSININKIYDYTDSYQIEYNIFSPTEASLEDLDQIDSIPDWRKSKICAEKSFYKNDYIKAKIYYQNLSCKNINHINEEIRSKIIQCSYFSGNYSDAISSCAEHLKSGCDIRTLPINRIAEYIAINSKYTDNNEELENKIVILNEYNKNISNDYTQQVSNLMENLLENLDIFSTNEIYDKNKKLKSYFIAKVMTSDVMDGMTCYFTSKSSISKERIRLVQYLIKESTEKNIKIYTNEIKSLTRKLIIDMCSNEAGDGKVNVDKESIKLQLQPEIEQALNELKSMPVKFDNNSKNHTLAIKNDVEYIYVSDDISNKLSEIIVSILEEYTINKLNGIDQSLNVGIRHGGMVNLLWAPLKDNNLSAIKSKDSKFFPNPKWKIDSAYYKDEILKKIDDHLVKFNIKVNNLILENKNKVHINTGEFIVDSKLFNYYIDIEWLNKISTKLDKFTAESLLDHTFSYLDSITNDCLEMARNQFIINLEHEYIQHLNELKHNLKENNVDIDWINRSIASAKIEAQSKIKVLKSYFDWLGKTDTVFNMEIAFEKAIDVIKEINPWATINCTSNISSKYNLKGELFYSMVSIFTLLLENITKHSNNDGIVSFHVTIHESQEKISIEIKNDILISCNIDKVNDISSKINEKYIDGSFKENGSGLFKIKRILSHDMKVANNINISIADTFRVYIEINELEPLIYEIPNS